MNPSPHPPSGEKNKSSRGRTGLLWLVVLALLAGAGYYAYRLEPARTGKKPGYRNDPMPVTTAVVKTGEFPVFLDAIGNARALNTATIRALVNGTLQKVRFTEGSSVKAGDLLAEIDPRPYQVQKAQAEGQLARDKALLANAKLDLERYRKAAEAVTRQQIDAAVSAVAQYEGAVETDRAAVAAADLQLTYCKVVAPFAGRVGIRQTDIGNFVSASDANGIVVLTQLQPISAFFYLPENSLAALMSAVAKNPHPAVEAWDSDKRRLLATGKLGAVDNQIDVATGTVKLRAVFDNKDLALFPNRSVYVRLLADTLKGVTLVPTPAVQIADKDRFLYVLKDDDTVERRTVTIGKADDRHSVILEGVKPGETIVIDGLDRLDTGVKVAPNARKPRGDKPATTVAGTTGDKSSSGKSKSSGN